MKKMILAFAMLLSFCASAQNFPGKKPELLTGKTLRVLPLSESIQKYGYSGFYKDPALKKMYKEDSFKTPYNELASKEFKVISLEAYNPTKDRQRFKLLIENPETGKLYFDYDPEFSFKFPFEVIGGLTYPEGFFCEAIYEKDMDEAEPDKRWYAAEVLEGVELVNVKNKSYDFMYLNINQTINEPYTPQAAQKLRRGITVTFDNGAVISRPDKKIEVKESSYGKVLLNVILGVTEKEELKLLKEHQIKSIKLHKEKDSEMKEGFTLREYLRCLLKDLE